MAPHSPARQRAAVDQAGGYAGVTGSTIHNFRSYLPWILEEHLIATLSLPLNLDQNRQHAFHARLSALRREAKDRANASPVRSARPVSARPNDADH
jgi:hypothetical protein